MSERRFSLSESLIQAMRFDDIEFREQIPQEDHLAPVRYVFEDLQWIRG